MLNTTNNSLYVSKTTEELQEIARKKNDAELDSLCNKCCLAIGWSSVLCFFIYGFYLFLTH
jgi:hypothetical protein